METQSLEKVPLNTLLQQPDHTCLSVVFLGPQYVCFGVTHLAMLAGERFSQFYTWESGVLIWEP